MTDEPEFPKFPAKWPAIEQYADGEYVPLEVLTEPPLDPNEHLHNDLDGDPAKTEHDNTMRAVWAASAVLTYGRRVYNGSCEEPVEQAMGDLLSDLRHLADALGLDFEQLLTTTHYDREIEGYL